MSGIVLRNTVIFHWLLNRFKICWQIWVKLDYVFWRNFPSKCPPAALPEPLVVYVFLMNRLYLVVKLVLTDNCTEHIWWRVQTQTQRPTAGRMIIRYPGPRWCMEFDRSRTATTCSLSHLANVSSPICWVAIKLTPPKKKRPGTVFPIVKLAAVDVGEGGVTHIQCQQDLPLIVFFFFYLQETRKYITQPLFSALLNGLMLLPLTTDHYSTYSMCQKIVVWVLDEHSHVTTSKDFTFW